MFFLLSLETNKSRKNYMLLYTVQKHFTIEIIHRNERSQFREYKKNKDKKRENCITCTFQGTQIQIHAQNVGMWV